MYRFVHSSVYLKITRYAILIVVIVAVDGALEMSAANSVRQGGWLAGRTDRWTDRGLVLGCGAARLGIFPLLTARESYESDKSGLRR